MRTIITDPIPRLKYLKRDYDLSSEILSLKLPSAEAVRRDFVCIEKALKSGQPAQVQDEANKLLKKLASFYRISIPLVEVLGVRPHQLKGKVCVSETFGDYHIRTMKIRLWMRTAIKKQITSPKTFVNTLCHEFCHHLDAKGLDAPTTPHTIGFFRRTALLYHRITGTRVKRLVWIRYYGQWMVSWDITNQYNDKWSRKMIEMPLHLGIREGTARLG